MGIHFCVVGGAGNELELILAKKLSVWLKRRQEDFLTQQFSWNQTDLDHRHCPLIWGSYSKASRPFYERTSRQMESPKCLRSSWVNPNTQRSDRQKSLGLAKSAIRLTQIPTHLFMTFNTQATRHLLPVSGIRVQNHSSKARASIQYNGDLQEKTVPTGFTILY